MKARELGALSAVTWRSAKAERARLVALLGECRKELRLALGARQRQSRLALLAKLDAALGSEQSATPMRALLFIATNFAVLLVLYVVMSLLGLDQA